LSWRIERENVQYGKEHEQTEKNLKMRRRNLTMSARAQQQQYCVGNWFLTWSTYIAILLQLSSMASATITVTETGQRFPSRPDHLVGQKFEDGFEYMARLQYIHSNLNLCPHNNNTIHVPNDGLPVALLAKSGGCSYEEKALFASLNIHPQNNIVKYIIIYDDETSPILNDEEEDDEDDIDLDDDIILELEKNLLLSNREDPEPSRVLSSSSFSFLDEQYDAAAAAAATPSSPTTTIFGGLHHRSKKRNHHNDNVSVGVLLISKHTGLELLRILVKDTYENRVLGGPRIIVDGKNWRDRARSIMLWVGVSFFSVACVCGCILIAQPDDFFIIRGETTTPPTRPARRRLTVEEVQEHLPEIEFDGSQLLFGGNVESKEGHDNHGNDSGEGEPQQGTTNNTSSLLNNRSILDSECSICLDDYHPGDMLRSLPCGHTFHSDCIAKWLTERSAVCPLCKAELVVVEDEESDEEDEEAESYASGGDYVEMRDTPPPSDANNDDGDDDTAAAAASHTQTTPTSSSWWRSLFSRHHRSHRQQLLSSEVTDQQQSEPLLPESTNDDEQVQEERQQPLPLGESEQQQQPLLEQIQTNNNVEENVV